MFFNLSDFSPFIQLLVGSVFFVNYYDSKHEEPFVEEMRNTKKAIDNLLQRFQGDYQFSYSKINWNQEKIYRLKIISLVLALFGCMLLLYSGIISSLANNTNSNQCCHNYNFQPYNLFLLLSIAIPSIIVFIFLGCVGKKYGKEWKNLKRLSEWIFWLMILFFVVFSILGMIFYFPCPTILVIVFHSLALFDCVFWIGTRYWKSWHLRKKLSNSYFELLKLYYKSKTQVDNKKISIETKGFDEITSGLSDEKKKELVKYIGSIFVDSLENNQIKFSDTINSLDNIKKEIEKKLEELNKIYIPDEQEQPKSCCSFCPHAINQSK